MGAMENQLIHRQYEQFLASLEGRTVRIDYDPQHDSLYVFGDEPWSPEIREKPRTFAVTSGIRIDVLLGNNRVYGAEIDDFQAALMRHGGHLLISWWEELPKDDSISVDGHRLLAAIQQVSLV